MVENNKLKLTIPFMWISVNEAYAGYKVRHKSNKYVEFENKMKKYFLELWEEIEITWNKFLSINYRLYFSIFNKDWTIKKKDTFNYEKCLTDSLCENIKWFDDKNIKWWSIWKFDSVNEYMEIEIIEI